MWFFALFGILVSHSVSAFYTGPEGQRIPEDQYQQFLAFQQSQQRGVPSQSNVVVIDQRQADLPRQTQAPVAQVTQNPCQFVDKGFSINPVTPFNSPEDSSSSSSSDDGTSNDGPINRPIPAMKGKSCPMQQTDAANLRVVQDFFQHAQNAIDTNNTLENVRADGQKLNGRSSHGSKAIGNFIQNWRGATWNNVHLTNSNIKHLRQSGTNMSNCLIQGKLSHVRYRRSYIANTTFNGNLKNVKFRRSEFNNVTFMGNIHKPSFLSVNETSFAKAKLFDVKFMGRDNDHMNLHHAKFKGAYFDDGVIFNNVDIDNASCFKGAQANINGQTWQITDSMRKQIKAQYPNGKIAGPVTMGEIMAKVRAPN